MDLQDSESCAQSILEYTTIVLELKTIDLVYFIFLSYFYILFIFLFDLKNLELEFSVTRTITY